MSDQPSARARWRPRSTSSLHIQPWRPHSARWPTCSAPAGPSSSWASATKRFCCSGRRDWDSSSRRHSFATASSASQVDPRLRRAAAVGALEHEPGALAGGVGGGDVEEVDVVAAGLAQRVGEAAGAEHVELEDVVQRLLEGHRRGAVDGDVGARELLGVEAAEALGGEVGGQRAQAAGGERLVGQPAGERLAREDLLHEPLMRGVVVGRAQQQRDRPGARDLAQPGRQDGLAEEPGGAREQQLRVGEPYGDALGHGGAHRGGAAGVRSGPGPYPLRRGARDREGVVERSRSQRRPADDRALVARGADRVPQRRLQTPARRDAGEGVRGQLEAAELAEVADAELVEPERLHRSLGAVDLQQDVRRDRGAVGDARGEAGARRLACAGHAERLGKLAHAGLGELDQRMHDAVLACRLQAGSPVAEVVGVRPGEHGGVAALGGDPLERVVQLGLAVVAAVPAVRAVALAVHLVGRDRLVGDPDRPCDVARAVELPGRQRG